MYRNVNNWLKFKLDKKKRELNEINKREKKESIYLICGELRKGIVGGFSLT